MAVEQEHPLIAAIRNDDEQAVREAAASGVEAKAGAKTALALAASLGRGTLVKALLDAGAADPKPDSPVWSAAMHAAFAGHADVLALLIAQDNAAAVGADAHGLRPLHLAAMKGHTACVKLLLDAAPDSLELPDARGRTALILAACSPAADLIPLLVERGAALTSTSADGKTALHWAVVSHQPQAVEALVKLGADMTARDLPPAEPILRPNMGENNGDTALDLASERQGKDPVYKHIAAYLKNAQKAREDGAELPSMKPMPWIVHAEMVKKQAAEAAIEMDAEPAKPAAVVESDIFDDTDAAPAEATGDEAVVEVMETEGAKEESGELDELD